MVLIRGSGGVSAEGGYCGEERENMMIAAAAGSEELANQRHCNMPVEVWLAVLHLGVGSRVQ